jgi:hypothetical protein
VPQRDMNWCFPPFPGSHWLTAAAGQAAALHFSFPNSKIGSECVNLSNPTGHEATQTRKPYWITLMERTQQEEFLKITDLSHCAWVSCIVLGLPVLEPQLEFGDISRLALYLLHLN